MISQKKGGVVLNYATLLSNVVVKFLYTPFLLYFLGQSEYGLFSLVMTIVGYMAILDLGFCSTVTRFTLKYDTVGDKDGLNRLFGTLSLIYVVIGLVAFSICFVMSYATDTLFGKAMTDTEVERLRLMIFLCGINLLFTFPLQIASSVVSAYERFIFKNSVQFFFVFFQPFVMVMLMYIWGVKSVGAIVVVTTCNFVTYLLYYFYARIKLNFRFNFKHFDKTMIGHLFKFSFAMFFLMLFEKVQFQSGQLVLGMFQGAKTVAVWGVAMIFIYNYRSISTAITNVYMPTFFRLSFSEDVSGLCQTVVKMTRIQGLVLCAILFNFILFGKAFVAIWAGNDYGEVYGLSLIIMIPMLFYLLLDFGYLIQIARNELKYRIITLFCSFLIPFIVALLFFDISLITYAIITAISIFLGQVVFVSLYVIRRTPVPIMKVVREIVKMEIVPVCFSIIYLLIYNSMFVTGGVVELVIYGAIYNLLLFVIYWYFSLNSEEKSLLKIKISR